ncbi:MAG: RNA-directed DNA polymerase [Lachnospiraceae bacterium]|nr:RNA-directed DNA polymerase [Lachnospiraceae bacterium]
MGMVEEITCNANNMYFAGKKTIKSSYKKESTQRFKRNLLCEIKRAQEELHDRSWKITYTPPFIIKERGHTRKIQGNIPYDRMIIHSYMDNVLWKQLERYIIYDNYASQTDKGTGKARERFKEFLHSAYREYGNNKFYVELLDFKKFYDNVQHQKLYDEIMRKVPYDPFHEYMIWTILDSMKVDVSYMTDLEYEDCLDDIYVALDHIYDDPSCLMGEKYMLKGLNIGNQGSQVFSIFYPTRVDNYCKNVRGVKRYGRFMDDISMIHNSKDFLLSVSEGMMPICEDMGLHINTKKTKIYRADGHITYLGRIYHMTASGHIIERLKPDTIHREIVKIKKFKEMYDMGIKTYESIEEQVQTWMGCYGKLLNFSQDEKIRTLYKELYGLTIKI